MGKPTGFMEFDRKLSTEVPAYERIQNFNEFHIMLSREEQRVQGARCMDCGVPFCQSGMTLGGMTSGCPLHNLIPEWNDLVYQGRWELALHRLRSTNRFPEFTSRVCPALCEASCTCGMATGNPVAVRENEYAIIETAYQKGWITPAAPPTRTGKSVAVVGSGPAGLAAAELLNKRGHSVTVFERDDRVGGLLMYGIPNMKLEKNVIDRKVDILKAEGIIFRTGCDVGRNVPAQELLDSFDAVVLACGAKQPRDLPVEGRDANGIYFAVDFLSAVTKSLLDSGLTDGACPTAQGKDVLIIGGGDTGNDCVGTSIRQGCASVTQLEMMPCPPVERAPGNEWPQWPRVLKVDYGQKESLAVFGKDPREYQTTVKQFYKDENGNVCGARVAKLAPQKDEASGRTMMVPTGEEYDVPCQMVLIAAGFTGCEPYTAQAFEAELGPRGTVAEQGYATSAPKVFTCGDMRRGQSLVVWALREGSEAASAVDQYLMGYTNL